MAQTMLMKGRMDIFPVSTHRFEQTEHDRFFEPAESAVCGKILFTP